MSQGVGNHIRILCIYEEWYEKNKGANPLKTQKKSQIPGRHYQKKNKAHTVMVGGINSVGEPIIWCVGACLPTRVSPN